MLKTVLAATVAVAALAGIAGTAEAHGYRYGYGYNSYSYGYQPSYNTYSYRTTYYYQPVCSYVTKRIYDEYGCERFIQVKVCN